MPRINKLKRDKAISALVAAGMAQSTAARYVRMLDLDSPLKDQIIGLAEDLPDLFGADDDTEDTDEPMTAREAAAARLRGSRVQDMAFRRPAQERPSSAPATAQEAAAHLRKNTGRNKPPTRQYIEPVRDINAATPAPAREPSASAKALAARLKG
ncbi:hypothetical protein [Streptomyces sp. HNA39]|uniref:hypothetical protein n=1 Tax=Streptomyces sp. HNA39 TaxID=2850561 RepID=UPI00200C1DC8|nr:hypothetical protein [Streptomyces sp. HNA39]UQA37497.1 hypothetical protein KRR37_30065 [Streptomyces sp. HNA39]